MHDAIHLIQKGIQHTLVSQLNPSDPDPGKGMVKLLDNRDNILKRVQSTDAIMAGSVLKLAKKRADKLSTTTGNPSSLPSPYKRRHRRKPID
jgi:hypothetical protein